jgi:hypothetical protein
MRAAFRRVITQRVPFYGVYQTERSTPEGMTLPVLPPDPKTPF